MSDSDDLLGWRSEPQVQLHGFFDWQHVDPSQEYDWKLNLWHTMRMYSHENLLLTLHVLKTNMMQKAAWPLEGSDVMWRVDDFIVVASTNNQSSKIRCVTSLTLNIEVSFFWWVWFFGALLAKQWIFYECTCTFPLRKGAFAWILQLSWVFEAGPSPIKINECQTRCRWVNARKM